MPTREIPRTEWTTFFNTFSSSRRGWMVTIEVLTPDLGDQIEVRGLPLDGITAELNLNGPDQIEIVAGARPDQHVSNTIVDPIRVWAKQNDQEADEALEIESESRTVLIRLRSPMHAEKSAG
jgi:hypothetical protein